MYFKIRYLFTICCFFFVFFFLFFFLILVNKTLKLENKVHQPFFLFAMVSILNYQINGGKLQLNICNGQRLVQNQPPCTLRSS